MHLKQDFKLHHYENTFKTEKKVVDYKADNKKAGGGNTVMDLWKSKIGLKECTEANRKTNKQTKTVG